MPTKAQGLALTRPIAVCYQDSFLGDPENTARAGLGVLGYDLLSIIYGTDFKGLFGQEVVPYGVRYRDAAGRVHDAIRGTDDTKEWAEDFFAVLRQCPWAPPGVLVHAGIFGVYETLVTKDGTPIAGGALSETLDTEGHSLGGGLAAIHAARLGAACGQCTTFEGPRVWNLAGANWADTRVPNFSRYVIVGDVVPHAPPENLGYFHPGIELDLDPSGVIPLTLDPKEYLRSHHVLDSVQLLLESP